LEKNRRAEENPSAALATGQGAGQHPEGLPRPAIGDLSKKSRPDQPQKAARAEVDRLSSRPRK